MSPSRSNTIWRPSGLTSTFVHVPSDVSNASFVVGPRSAVTSDFLSSFLSSFCCAERGAIASPRRRAKRNERIIYLAFCFFVCVLFSRLRQRYQHATVRYGRHDSPSFLIRAGLGLLRRPYARWMALTIPRSSTGRTSGRRRRNIRNI